MHFTSKKEIIPRFSSSERDLLWNDLYQYLMPHIWYWIHTSNISSWNGQEDDILDDIIQEVVVRVFIHIQKIEPGADIQWNYFKSISLQFARRYFITLKKQDKRLVQLSELNPLHKLWVIQNEDISSFASLAIINANVFETMAEIMVLVLPDHIRQMMLRHLSVCTDIDAYEQLKNAFEKRGVLLEIYQQDALSAFYQKDQRTDLFLPVCEYIKEKTGTLYMEENQYIYVEETLEKANDMLKQMPESKDTFSIDKEPFFRAYWEKFQQNIPSLCFVKDLCYQRVPTLFFAKKAEKRQLWEHIEKISAAQKYEEEEWQDDPTLVDLSKQLRASSSSAINPDFEAQLRAKLLHMMDEHKALQEEREIEKETLITNIEEVILTQLSGLASDIVELPEKQRQTLLTDLAHRLPSTKNRLPLEQALLEEGIGLQKYQEPHFIESMNNSIDDREQRQLLFSAYRKMSRIFKKFYQSHGKNQNHFHFV